MSLNSQSRQLIKRFLDGDRLAVSRIITYIENAHPQAHAILDLLYLRAGRAYRVGITGPPGVGKSTLVDKLALTWRRQGHTLGIVAVDPTSPFSGGALLGDRLRMESVATDPGVFIRSMATRGSQGGLARSTKEVMVVLDAFGKTFVLTETVGVGQAELDIAAATDTTVVIVSPDSGDSIQAMKAGLMEIADILVVNKADRPGARQQVMELEMMLDLRQVADAWRPPVLKTQAGIGEGIALLAGQIQAHRAHLEERGLLAQRRARQLRSYIKKMAESGAQMRFWENGERRKRLEILTGQALAGEIGPYQAAQELLGE